MSAFRFITHRPFWVNLLAILVITFLLIFGFLQSLDFFTNHGKVLKVPSVTGKTLSQASQELEQMGFDVEIQDSVYKDDVPPGSVIKQFPEADLSVKVNRTVFLTINRTVPPIIDMPNLLNMSFRSAEDYLKSIGLKLGDTSYKPDFAKNAVIQQLWNGADVKPGTKIPMGSRISLVFGSGIGSEEMAVPDLFGMTLAEAEVVLDANGLSRGATVVDPDVKDTASAFVYKQSPERMGEEGRINRIRPGQLLTIWLGLQKPVRQDSTSANPNSNPDF
jgi:beta-lactam-binding protein with PASTA domain